MNPDPLPIVSKGINSRSCNKYAYRRLAGQAKFPIAIRTDEIILETVVLLFVEGDFAEEES